MDQMTPRRPDRDDEPDRRDDDRRDDERRDADRDASGREPTGRDHDGGPAERRAPAHDILALSRGFEASKDAAAQAGPGGPEEPSMPSRWIFVGVGLVLCLALAWGVYGHWKKDAAAGDTQLRQADRIPAVRVVKARSDDDPIALTLPGETQPFATANIYARATGYITERRADIGTRVRKGDLLVHISAPDLDQQLEQAEATLGQVAAALLQAQANVSQSEASLNLAKVNLQRAQALVGRGFETLQNRDQLQANQISQGANLDAARAGVKVAEANVRAQQATIDRLKALTGFEDVRAPFDGVVTVRNVDVGTLVNADTATGTPMFTVDEDDVLRVLVQVPQNASIGVRNGLQARIAVPQMPGRTFVGTVSRSSSALQSSARTLTVEVDIPNEAGVLRSGLYAYVTLDIPRDHPVVVLPSETLIFDRAGTRVAVVGEGDAVRMVPVTIRRDFGTSFEVDPGPKGGEPVVLSPPASLREGAKVRVQTDGVGAGQGEPGGDQPKAAAPATAVTPAGDGAPGAGSGTDAAKLSEK